jgi:tetratricopeptide (TPR) repeat protein
METALLEKQAIQAALTQAWEKAVGINKKLLKIQPGDVAALNRLGRAYWELGKLTEARKTYKKVLTIDRYNPIASKNLKRLVGQKSITKKPLQKELLSPGEIFLEEPGKTKVIKLVRLASPQILNQLSSSHPVTLVPRKRNISVLSEDGTYLGTIPDDLSQRLVNFIKGGNRYQAFVKGVGHQHLEIFIREVFRSRKFQKIPSFPPSSSSYIPFLAPETIHEEKPEVTPTGEEEEPETSSFS